MKRFLIPAVVLSLLPVASAMACGGPCPKDPAPQPVPTSQAAAGAVAGAAGIGTGIGMGGTGGDGGRAAAAGGHADASAEAAGGSGVGVVEGDRTQVEGSWGVALSVPAATAAPAVASQCMVHSRGWSAGMGVAARSGGTRFDPDCMKRVQCLQLADRLAAWQQYQLAVAQLQQCGAVAGEYVQPAPAKKPVYATPGDVGAAEHRISERIDRAIRAAAGKGAA